MLHRQAVTVGDRVRDKRDSREGYVKRLDGHGEPLVKYDDGTQRDSYAKHYEVIAKAGCKAIPMIYHLNCFCSFTDQILILDANACAQGLESSHSFMTF